MVSSVSAAPESGPESREGLLGQKKEPEQFNLHVWQAVDVDSPYVRGVAGVSQRTCAAGVLLWNVPTPWNGQPQQDGTVSITLQDVPFSHFNVEAYIIDDRRQPNVSHLP